ncbi:MAG: CPBP family intramembrane glutamic endopeptidase [Spirochaetia bacterium]|nr:CPBP family intramembrane glutamic endopeptidase [Spirochaetia bacterium]
MQGKNIVKEINSLKKASLLVFVIIVLILSPQLGKIVANNFASFFSVIESDRIFVYPMIHHLVQALIPLVIILVLCKKIPLRDWGFQIGNKKKGIKSVLWISVGWLLINILIIYLGIFKGMISQVYYDVTNNRNLFGEFIFRLFSGPSEELLFRAFPIKLLLIAGFSQKTDIFGFEITKAGIIAAIIFSLAHIHYTIYPTIAITNIDFLLLVTTLGFGLIYAIVFQKTKSIYYPMIIHSIVNIFGLFSVYIIHLNT